MATQDEYEEDDLSCCPVCLEEYEESGDKVPRLLPCSHTLCDRCIKTLLQGGLQIKCPECRQVHAASKEMRTFLQNKYILSHIRIKKKAPEKLRDRKLECPEHNKELVLFCGRAECQKPICQLCLTESHRKHDVVDFETGENILRINLDREIEVTCSNIEKSIRDLTKTKEKLAEDDAKLLPMVLERKIIDPIPEIMNVIEEMYRKEVDSAKERFQKLCKLKRKVNKDYRTLVRAIETAKQISCAVGHPKLSVFVAKAEMRLEVLRRAVQTRLEGKNTASSFLFFC